MGILLKNIYSPYTYNADAACCLVVGGGGEFSKFYRILLRILKIDVI